MFRTSYRVGEWRIAATIAGSGPPLFLVHGLGASSQWWEPTFQELAPEFTVCAIDLPGSGESSPLIKPPTDTEFAGIISGMFDLLGPGRRTVIAHSLGGFVIAKSLLQGVKGISSLILVSPAGFGPIENKYFRLLSLPFIGEVAVRSGKAGLGLLIRSLVHNPVAAHQIMPWVDASPSAQRQFLFQLRLGLNQFGITNRSMILEGPFPAQVRTRLICGLHDSVFSVKTNELARSAFSAPLDIFENSGHFPQLEEPRRFHEIVREFTLDRSGSV